MVDLVADVVDWDQISGHSNETAGSVSIGRVATMDMTMCESILDGVAFQINFPEEHFIFLGERRGHANNV